MTQKIPSAREMEASRKVLYFRDDEDSRLAVCVELRPNGLWAAGLDDDPEAGWPGSGETMLEAIADLRSQLAEEG